MLKLLGLFTACIASLILWFVISGMTEGWCPVFIGILAVIPLGLIDFVAILAIIA